MKNKNKVGGLTFPKSKLTGKFLSLKQCDTGTMENIDQWKITEGPEGNSHKMSNDFQQG